MWCAQLALKRECWGREWESWWTVFATGCTGAFCPPAIAAHTNTNQYHLLVNPPTLTTISTVQTTQQNVGYNQVLNLQPIGGSIKLSQNTTASSNLYVLGFTTLNNVTSCILSLNVSGITTFPNRVCIGTTASTYVNFDVLGVANFHNGTRFVASNYTLNPGNLILSSTALNYGGGTDWNGGNAAGLLMECSDNTGIVVHDSGKRLASLIIMKATQLIKLPLIGIWGGVLYQQLILMEAHTWIVGFGIKASSLLAGLKLIMSYNDGNTAGGFVLIVQM